MVMTIERPRLHRIPLRVPLGEPLVTFVWSALSAVVLLLTGSLPALIVLGSPYWSDIPARSEEHTSELQSH